MNLGALSGYWSGYEIVAAQTGAPSLNGDTILSAFYAPPEATIGLITASAPGVNGYIVYFDGVDTWYGSTGGGGAGGACFRYPFNLSTYRYIPYTINYTSFLKIGGLGMGGDVYNYPLYGSPGEYVYLGVGGFPQGTDQSGGDGGVAFSAVYSGSSSANLAYLNPGTGGSGYQVRGGNGKVQTLYNGGVIASGAGGGGYYASGGSVHSPWGTQAGGISTSGMGGGGASLLSPGVGGTYSASANTIISGGLLGKRSTFFAGVNGYMYGIPGAGLPGGVADSITNYKLYSAPFIKCEFIAPRR